MRISEVAERSGVPATTLRFYETIGLLPVARNPAGYRDYDDAALERLAVIGSAKRLGLTLDDIAEVLGVWSTGSCAQTKRELAPRLHSRLAESQRQAAALLARAAALGGALAHLDRLPDSGEQCGPDCVLPAPSEPEPIPIACSLTAAGCAARGIEWRAVLDGATRSPLPDGVRIGVPAERAAALAELAVAERECCPFFDLRLDVDLPLVQLEVRAPGAAMDLLTEVFGIAG